jgi:hypothetical protein
MRANKPTKFIYMAIALLLCACSGDNTPNSPPSAASNGPSPSPVNTSLPIGALKDVNDAANEVSEQTIVNGVEVGITVISENASKYTLLDDANGRFAIDELTGVVFLNDYLLLNANIYPEHTITVQASSKDGLTINENFYIAVVAENIPITSLSDFNGQSNELLEGIHTTSKEVGITAKANDPDDKVRYSLSTEGEAEFVVDETQGVVKTKAYSQFDANAKRAHTIKIQAASEDGSKQSKDFSINVLNNYENNVSLVTSFTPLLNWNAGSDQTFEGWDWLDDVAYGNNGWLLSENGPIGGGERYSWGWGPRSFNKGDYGKKNSAVIDPFDRAPSTADGGSLKVFETENSTDHRSTWWLWYDGKPLSERGITNAKTDRMDFYLKAEGMDGVKDDGRKESLTNNFHIGTYLCWKTSAPAHGRGDGCPYEGPGNQHYYHYLGISPGAWIHVVLDQFPQHIRGKTRKLSNNPTWGLYKKNYFEQLSQFYFEIRARQNKKTNFRIDELNFYSTENMVEPNQNDISISSLWVGYWADKGGWEIGFHDKSLPAYNDDFNSTFEIRWSVSPITNANFEKAEVIEPKFYNGSAYAGKNSEHLIRRANGWTSNVWTRFNLSRDVEEEYSKIYFAVKDVSVKGKHVGTKWPYNKGDGHDAPTKNIKIIDYYLRPPQN